MRRTAFGYHLIVNASGCNDSIQRRDAIAAFARDLVRAIDMKAYGAPVIEHFGHDEPKASGFTLVQLIETSHVAAHFCDNSGEAYFDIFSCKDYDQAEALRVIDAYFAPKLRTIEILTRQAPTLNVPTRQLVE